MSLVKTEKNIKSCIEELFPKIEVVKKYGGFLYNSEGNDHFCGVFTYKDHVSLEFSNGHLLKDPKNTLKGSGKYRRHLKFKAEDEISLTDLKKFLREAYKNSKT